MSGTCKEWFDSIGCKSTLDKEQYTHLVWCAALASKVENFTDNQQLKAEIAAMIDDAMWRIDHQQYNEAMISLKEAMRQLSAV